MEVTSPSASARVMLAVATLGPIGRLPGAPGTYASLVTLPVGYLLLAQFGIAGVLTAAIAITVCGIIAGGIAVRVLKREDPPEIVIDEVAGQLFALLPALAGDPIHLIVAFVLFRLFDIVKPWPISVIDAKVRGGFGVMADDVAAGVFAAALLLLLRSVGAI